LKLSGLFVTQQKQIAKHDYLYFIYRILLSLLSFTSFSKFDSYILDVNLESITFVGTKCLQQMAFEWKYDLIIIMEFNIFNIILLRNLHLTMLMTEKLLSISTFDAGKLNNVNANNEMSLNIKLPVAFFIVIAFFQKRI
jgi:hypothetical protein